MDADITEDERANTRPDAIDTIPLAYGYAIEVWTWPQGHRLFNVEWFSRLTNEAGDCLDEFGAGDQAAVLGDALLAYWPMADEAAQEAAP